MFSGTLDFAAEVVGSAACLKSRGSGRERISYEISGNAVWERHCSVAPRPGASNAISAIMTLENSCHDGSLFVPRDPVFEDFRGFL